MDIRDDHARCGPTAQSGRRATSPACRPRGRARLRGGVRALPPAAVPLLPVDRARRCRRAGCAPVHVHARTVGAEARSAQRTAAAVAVPARAQRVDLGATPAPGRLWPGAAGCGSILLAPSAEDQAGERARLGVLMGDLAALPDRARNALVMRELSGLSHQDIAIALEISEGAAKQAIFEARRGLQECAEGRTMPCAEVCRAISDADRRVLRGRRVRAHLRDCASCATFASAIKTRRSELSALVPVLPAASSVAVLSRVMESGVGHAAAAGGGVAGGGVAGSGAAVAGTAGKTLGIAMGSKGFAAASLLATAAVSVGGVAAVVRLAHDGRPSLSVGERHAVVAGPAAHTIARARSGSGSMTGHARGLPSIATRGRRVTAPAKSPARITSAQGHGRAASWHGRPASSHGQSGSLSHGQSATSSDGKSASSHGKGHANGASLATASGSRPRRASRSGPSPAGWPRRTRPSTCPIRVAAMAPARK